MLFVYFPLFWFYYEWWINVRLFDGNELFVDDDDDDGVENKPCEYTEPVAKSAAWLSNDVWRSWLIIKKKTIDIFKFR